MKLPITTIMKSCVTKLEFCKKKLLSQKWEKWASTEPKIVFLEFIDKFVH